MRILKVLLYILLGIVALVVLLGVFGKKDYHIERSIEIRAPESMIYDYVSHFKNFNQWSPWASYDPNMKVKIEGTDGEAGCVYSWEGNKKVGRGSQTLKSLAADRIDLDIKFMEPMESTSPVFYAFEDRDTTTKVSWGFDMHVGFPWNGLAMFTDMDAAIGKDYERGLETLKKNCEQMASERYKGLKIVPGELQEQTFVGLRKTIPMAEVGNFYAATLPKVLAALQKAGISMSGAPAGLYWSWDEATKTSDMAAVIPITGSTYPGKDLQVFTVPAGRALTIDYYGGYDKVGDAHMAMDAWMADRKQVQAPPVIESYVTDPGTEPDTAKWLTKVIYYIQK